MNLLHMAVALLALASGVDSYRTCSYGGYTEKSMTEREAYHRLGAWGYKEYRASREALMSDLAFLDEEAQRMPIWNCYDRRCSAESLLELTDIADGLGMESVQNRFKNGTLSVAKIRDHAKYVIGMCKEPDHHTSWLDDDLFDDVFDGDED